MDILLIIVNSLSLLDYLSVCRVCKCWRSAFLECWDLVSENKVGLKWLPWFVLLNTEDVKVDDDLRDIKTPILYTTGEVGDLSTDRTYTLDLPELCGTRFLLSRHGWLLLFSSTSTSLFFLNPFSRERIDLPFKDISKLCSPVLDISAPPTSSDCILFVIGCARGTAFEISTCARGESTWKTKLYKNDSSFGPVVNIVFVKKEMIWYCLHMVGDMSAFDVANGEWKHLGFPNGKFKSYIHTTVSYVMKHGDQVHLYVHGTTPYEVVLQQSLKIVERDGCTISSLGDVESLFRTCINGAILKLQHLLEVDSFNLHAWCGMRDTENHQKLTTFRWHDHRSFVDRRYKLKQSCFAKDNCTNISLFHPALPRSSLNYDWMSCQH